MARIDWVEARLQRWAEACTVGDGSGYATMSVLHPNWSPPGGGQAPSMKVARANDVLETMRAVDQLSLKLHQAVIVHYCKRGPIERQCEECACSAATLYRRIDVAHAEIARLLELNRMDKSPKYVPLNALPQELERMLDALKPGHRRSMPDVVFRDPVYFESYEAGMKWLRQKGLMYAQDPELPALLSVFRPHDSFCNKDRLG